MILSQKVERVSGITHEQFNRDFVVPEIPVIVCNAVADWPALDKWSPEYLDSKIGNVRMEMKKSASCKHPDLYQPSPGVAVPVTFSDYIKKTFKNPDARDRVKYYLSGDENYFFGDGEWNDKLASLRDDFQLPAFFSPDALQQVSFWISVRGLFAWLHFDGNCCHNLNVQVSGSKRVHLIDPREMSRLYPVSLRETPDGFNFSKVDSLNYNAEMFPQFKNARYQEAVLEKGDMLFIPATWYHEVHHLGEENINVNFWWRPDALKANPVLRRTEMFQLFSQAYLQDAIAAQRAPQWENWCNANPHIAELIFKCDEHLLATPE